MTLKANSLTHRVSELVSAAGIDNFHMVDNILVMCGVRYVVEQCGCDDPECHGLRLRREDGGQGSGYFALQ